jgi:hypothetical protein
MVDEPTILISTVPAQAQNVEAWLRMEPRAWTAAGVPVWDTTDEMYITYDQEGNHADSTTSGQEEWDEERKYQQDQAAGNSSLRYESLRDLSGADPGRNHGGSDRPSIRPEWYGGDGTTREYPSVQNDSDRTDPGAGFGIGTATDHNGYGAGIARAPGTGDSPLGSGLPERAAIRSHRHCPGCTGHGNTRGSWVWLLLRDIGAFAVGWLAVYTTKIAINFPQYVILVTLGVICLGLAQPSWREYINSRDRYARGGRL